ncbi:hypothetical protein AKG12_20570 [Agrobacterium sp. SUL3]|nr:hypothetical protein AKG12_20570 [Agrobacterium sp. SUL3]
MPARCLNLAAYITICGTSKRLVGFLLAGHHQDLHDFPRRRFRFPDLCATSGKSTFKKPDFWTVAAQRLRQGVMIWQM